MIESDVRQKDQVSGPNDGNLSGRKSKGDEAWKR